MLCVMSTRQANNEQLQEGACLWHPDPKEGTGMSSMTRRTHERLRLTLLLGGTRQATSGCS